MSEQRENISWVVGALVSGVLHIGAGVGAARYGTLALGSGSERIGADGTVVLLSPQDETSDLDTAVPPPPPPPPMELPKPDPDAARQPMRLGIRESSQDTDAWLGFNEATPHSGMMSTLDQAQLSLQPGDAGTPGEAAQASGAPASGAEQAPAAQTMPAEATPATESALPAAANEQPKTEPAPESPLPKGDAKPGEADGAKIETPRDKAMTPVNGEPVREGLDPASKVEGDAVREAAPPASADASKSPDATVTAPVEVRDDPLLPQAPPAGLAPNNPPAQGSAPPQATGEQAQNPAMAANPAMQAAPQGGPGAAPTPATGTQGSAKATPGNKSDRESDAASKRGPIEVRPGKPAAGQGLEIQTVRPQWSITVRLTSVPKNPLVRIVFGPDGKVKSAAFLLGQDTGSTEVDGPLLDAIYRWTAKGKAIDELPKNDPKAGVPLIMRVVLKT